MSKEDKWSVVPPKQRSKVFEPEPEPEPVVLKSKKDKKQSQQKPKSLYDVFGSKSTQSRDGSGQNGDKKKPDSKQQKKQQQPASASSSSKPAEQQPPAPPAEEVIKPTLPLPQLLSSIQTLQQKYIDRPETFITEVALLLDTVYQPFDKTFLQTRVNGYWPSLSDPIDEPLILMETPLIESLCTCLEMLPEQGLLNGCRRLLDDVFKQRMQVMQNQLKGKVSNQVRWYPSDETYHTGTRVLLQVILRSHYKIVSKAFNSLKLSIIRSNNQHDLLQLTPSLECICWCLTQLESVSKRAAFFAFTACFLNPMILSDSSSSTSTSTDPRALEMILDVLNYILLYRNDAQPQEEEEEGEGEDTLLITETQFENLIVLAASTSTYPSISVRIFELLPEIKQQSIFSHINSTSIVAYWQRLVAMANRASQEMKPSSSPQPRHQKKKGKASPAATPATPESREGGETALFSEEEEKIITSTNLWTIVLSTLCECAVVSRPCLELWQALHLTDFPLSCSLVTALKEALAEAEVQVFSGSAMRDAVLETIDKLQESNEAIRTGKFQSKHLDSISAEEVATSNRELKALKNAVIQSSKLSASPSGSSSSAVQKQQSRKRPVGRGGCGIPLALIALGLLIGGFAYLMLLGGDLKDIWHELQEMYDLFKFANLLPFSSKQ